MSRSSQNVKNQVDVILRKYDKRDERLFHDRYLSSSSNGGGAGAGAYADFAGAGADDFEDDFFYDPYEAANSDVFSDGMGGGGGGGEWMLRSKWLDNSPRMSKVREQRQKRLVNRLEQFELWDLDQEQKQRQYEKAREQRYQNIMERLKSQDFCLNTMRKRHETDMETTRDLELYPNDHLFVDALDDPKLNIQGPLSQYRQFEAQMDEKVKVLLNDLDTLNPRNRIEQAILPRLERTRENFSVEPQLYTRQGKRIQSKRSLEEGRRTLEKSLGPRAGAGSGSCVRRGDSFSSSSSSYHQRGFSVDTDKPKSILHAGSGYFAADPSKKSVYFNDSRLDLSFSNKPRTSYNGYN